MYSTNENQDLVLSMQGIVKAFGKTVAVRNGRLEVRRGEVHALIGENGAGKSTLMNLLCGVLKPDEGTITYLGKQRRFSNVRAASRAGVVMIYQELNTLGDLTVAQNMFIGREPKKMGLIDDAKMIAESERILQSLGSDIDPREKCANLSVAARQMVEIAKALTNDIRILVLDEPTTALGTNDAELLFRTMENLRSRGISMIYISHRMDEILRIADRITVMRDGEYIQTLRAEDTTKEEIISLLVGRALKNTRKLKSEVSPNAERVLEVRGLCIGSAVRDASFFLRKGEVLGIAGLMGAGRSELMRGVCGVDKTDRGTVFRNGSEVRISSPERAKEYGMCYLSENRNEFGLLLDQSIAENTVLSSIPAYSRFGFINDGAMIADAERYNETVKTKMSSVFEEVRNLSGGNRQKVIIARWLINDPDILIFDEPTKGIDVGAKDEIYEIVKSLTARGKSVIIISSEISELQSVCDRILVMCEGRITKELDISEASQETIMKYALKRTGGASDGQ